MLLIPVLHDVVTQGLCVEADMQEGGFGDVRDGLGEDACCCAAVDGPSAGGGQADFEAGLDPVVGGDHTGAVQDLLTGGADAHFAAVTPVV